MDLLVRDNLASGMEVREGGELDLEYSVVKCHQQQGVMMWCGGARMEIRHC